MPKKGVTCRTSLEDVNHCHFVGSEAHAAVPQLARKKAPQPYDPQMSDKSGFGVSM